MFVQFLPIVVVALLTGVAVFLHFRSIRLRRRAHFLAERREMYRYLGSLED